MEHSSKATVLEIEHLQKYYKKNIGVKDISLSVKKGVDFLRFSWIKWCRKVNDYSLSLGAD